MCHKILKTPNGIDLSFSSSKIMFNIYKKTKLF